MEISAKSLFEAVLKKWWILAIALIVGSVAGLFWGEVFTSDEYVSEAKIYITLKPVSGESGNNQSATKIQECVTVLGDDYFLKQQYELQGVKITSKEIHNNVSFTTSGSFIIIRVATDDPETSYKVASAIAREAKAQILNTSLADSVEDVTQEGRASLPDTMQDKGTLMKLLLAGIIAMGLTAVVLIIIRLNDKRVYTTEELPQLYNLPVLGTVPDDEI